jgi:hypothetical protein
MVGPCIKEVPTCGSEARTWIAEVHFEEAANSEKLAALMVHISGKPFSFATFELAKGKVLVLMHSLTGKICNSNCKIMLSRLFKAVKIEVSIPQLSALNGYHLELFGLKEIPSFNQEEPERRNSEEVSSGEEEVIGNLTSDVRDMSQFRRICDEYFAKRQHDALAIPTQAARSGAGESRDKKLQWLTEIPDHLEVVTKRNLRESQKLEWILFRDRALHGDDSMRTAPTVHHWPNFFSMYADISRIGDQKREAFKTFSAHVQAVTGKTISREDLPTEDADKIPIDGKCFQCSSSIPLWTDMDGQIITNLGQVVCRGIEDKKVAMDASRFGIFCSRRCARDRCFGCAKALVGGKCPDRSCKDDQRRNLRPVVPLGYGDYHGQSDEYVGVMEFGFAKRGLPLTWPMCRAKKQCPFHTCLHVCERDCQHDCSGCRVHNGSILFGKKHYCACDPCWIQKQKPEEIDADFYEIDEEEFLLAEAQEVAGDATQDGRYVDVEAKRQRTV